MGLRIWPRWVCVRHLPPFLMAILEVAAVIVLIIYLYNELENSRLQAIQNASLQITNCLVELLSITKNKAKHHYTSNAGLKGNSERYRLVM